MEILNKTGCLLAPIDILEDAKIFLQIVIAMRKNEQIALQAKQAKRGSVCGDIIQAYGYSDKLPSVGSEQEIDIVNSTVQVIRCIKIGNHSGNHKGHNPFRLGGKFLEWPNKEEKQDENSK